jgi:hypothetical protein
MNRKETHRASLDWTAALALSLPKGRLSPHLLLGIAGVLCICGIVIGGAKAQSGRQSGRGESYRPKKAEEQFKNIQALKGIPADQLIPAMQFITTSLGVECEFCHVEGAFEKDDKKPKQTARKMMEMMFAINKDNFDGTSRGDLLFLPPRQHRAGGYAGGDDGGTEAGHGRVRKNSEEAEEVKPTGRERRDQLFDKYLQAVGGAAALDKITSRVMKGRSRSATGMFPSRFSRRVRTSAYRSRIRPTETALRLSTDMKAGWAFPKRHTVREMHGPDIDAAVDGCGPSVSGAS